jgi:hypothetical protein
MKVVVFLGPSLPVAAAREVLDAVYLPPAAQADLVSAVETHRPDVIGLIDGYFGQSLSVWHKEILYALDRGVRVYGASSMGALRAAETAPFGTVGVGTVYEMFASGELTDDDEVAVVHGLAETGYRNLTVPMVNVRVTLREAARAGVVTEDDRVRLEALAKAVFYQDRTYPAVFKRAAADGFPADRLAALREYVARHAADVKRDDALALLRTVRDLPRPLPPFRPGFEFARSHLFAALYNRDRTVPAGGHAVPLETIAHHAALHHPEFNDLNFHALNRALVGVLADQLGVTVTDAEAAEEEDRFRRRRRLRTDADLTAWREANHLNPAEFRDLMTELARCRRLHRWLVVRRYQERTVKPVLDELRLRGEYPARAAAAAEFNAVVEDLGPPTADEDAGDWMDLWGDHMRATGCRPDAHFTVWAEDAGFHTLHDLRRELANARRVRETVRRRVAGLQNLAADSPAESTPEGG